MDESVVIMKADKGNATVIIDKEDYQEKINALLDPNIYIVL